MNVTIATACDSPWIARSSAYWRKFIIVTSVMGRGSVCTCLFVINIVPTDRDDL
jgi:hypothetical protein